MIRLRQKDDADTRFGSVESGYRGVTGSGNLFFAFLRLRRGGE
jgi:hypothetical protein